MAADYSYGTQLANRVYYTLTREQDLPRSFLRSVVEYEYSYYEK